MRKVLLVFSYCVVALFGLSAFGWMVKHVVLGTKDFGPTVNSTVKEFVSFLDLSKATVKEVKSLPETFVPTPADFTPVNKLANDLWTLVTFSDEDNKRTVELLNLRNDSVALSWQIGDVSKSQDRIMHPLMLKDSSLVYSFNQVSGITCLDKNGKLLWKQDSIKHHHSMNLGHDGNIWACTYTPAPAHGILYRGTFRMDGRPLNYVDNKFSKLDAKTGRILFHKSTSQIITESGLDRLFAKTGNGEDPMHLNDIQPALKDGPYWKQEDLFLSFRNMSCVLQYRPSTDTIVRVIEGPFYAQHDIDILNDSTLSIFNNNAQIHWETGGTQYAVADSTYNAGNLYSNLVYYHANTDTYEVVAKETFANNYIYTFTEGLAEQLPNNRLFVEEQNSGVLWVLDGDDVLYKNVLKSQHEGYHHLSNWTRLIDEP